MSSTPAEILRQLLDLGVVLCTIGALGYMLFSGALRSRLLPSHAGALIFFGLGLGVAIYLVDAIDLFLPLPIEPESGAAFVDYTMPEWLHWLMTRAAFLTILIGIFLAALHRKQAEDVIGTADKMVKVAADSIAKSEARFRYLFETTSNSIFCYTFDPPMPVKLTIDEQVRRSHHAVLAECNEVFAKTLDTLSPAAIIGTKMGMLDGNKDTEAHHEFFKSFIENDYRLTDYELIYKTPGGQDRAVRRSLTGIVKDGLLHRFWGAESDILDMRKTQAALHQRRKYQDLLADISSRLVTTPLERADEVVKQCMIELCQHTGADRTALVWYDNATENAELTHRWTAKGTRYETPVTAWTFAKTTEHLKNNIVVRVDDCQNPPAAIVTDRPVFIKRGLKSFVALPLEVDGNVVGVSTYAHTRKKRSWTDLEISDLRVFAELFASYMLRLKSRRALDDAVVGLQRATDRLEAENVYLRQEIKRTQGFDEIIGQSDTILRCLHKVEQVADTMTSVLVCGETGTGKELIARAIHEHSSRRDRPLVKVNCAALPANLIESELFGYEKGAFTGADRTKRGRFDLANGSTLFLDEIADIPFELQAKLLRALQEGEIERLGGTETIKVDVRIIAATNRNLAEAVNQGEFRSDLYYRINMFPIELPPLRARGDDIHLLTENFVRVHAKSLGREVSAISATMMRHLSEYHWPGNVRELDGVIQRALISSTSPVLELADPLTQISSTLSMGDIGPRILSTSIADLRVVEREHIVSVLEEANWKISGHSGAANKLGIPPSTLRSKMKKLLIARPPSSP